MEVEIHLENPFFSWTQTEGNTQRCWLKGDLFYKGSLLEGPGILSLINSLPSSAALFHTALNDLFSDFNGSFALVVETRDSILCVVDRIRSIPLFYAITGTRFIIADDATYIVDQMKLPFNEKNGAEFLVTGFVTGHETLFDGVEQIRGGEYRIYSKKDHSVTPVVYHRFWHKDFFSGSDEELLKYLDTAFVHVFQRLIASAKRNGFHIVVPLSGGLDSRIIVAMLKRLGVEDVICFSYGKKGNHEAEISKKVAEALGYQWYFVEYTHDKWNQCYHSDEARAFQRYAGNVSVLPHFQDFLAVKELKETGKIPKNAVFVPGHSGNLIAGDCLPRKILSMSFTRDQFISFSLDEHYLLWPWYEKGGEDLRALFQQKILQSVGDIDIYDAESLANAIEYFNGYERQGKFIVNSVRVYEFFGYAWRIPFWDAELMDFFLKVPLKYRMRYTDGYLYMQFAKNNLFVENRKKLHDIECTTEIDYVPNDTLKKKCESVIDNNKIVKRFWLQFYFFKKRLITYKNDPYYGMIQKEKFLKFYSGKQILNSFLVMDYLEKFTPDPLNLLQIKKRR